MLCIVARVYSYSSLYIGPLAESDGSNELLHCHAVPIVRMNDFDGDRLSTIKN